MINATLVAVRSSVKKTFQGRKRQRLALFYSCMDVGWSNEYLHTVCTIFTSISVKRVRWYLDCFPLKLLLCDEIGRKG